MRLAFPAVRSRSMSSTSRTRSAFAASAPTRATIGRWRKGHSAADGASRPIRPPDPSCVRLANPCALAVARDSDQDLQARPRNANLRESGEFSRRAEGWRFLRHQGARFVPNLARLAISIPMPIYGVHCPTANRTIIQSEQSNNSPRAAFAARRLRHFAECRRAVTISV